MKCVYQIQYIDRPGGDTITDAIELPQPLMTKQQWIDMHYEIGKQLGAKVISLLPIYIPPEPHQRSYP